MPDPSTHPTLSFALEVADKAIKLAAVLLGGVWTYWNYRKSRTYEQKIELQMSNSIFVRNGIYLQVSIVMKNVGAAKHTLQQQGTSCKLTAIHSDLSEKVLRVFRVFTQDDYIEPSESISDHLLYRIEIDTSDIVWLRADLRVTSSGVEWYQSGLVRMETEIPSSSHVPNKGEQV